MTSSSDSDLILDIPTVLLQTVPGNVEATLNKLLKTSVGKSCTSTFTDQVIKKLFSTLEADIKMVILSSFF